MLIACHSTDPEGLRKKVEVHCLCRRYPICPPALYLPAFALSRSCSQVSSWGSPLPRLLLVSAQEPVHHNISPTYNDTLLHLNSVQMIHFPAPPQLLHRIGVVSKSLLLQATEC